jgi:uncharacterized ParB-like nuclease family protein
VNRGASCSGNTQEDEAFEERAAIMQYDGGLSAGDAEAAARVGFLRPLDFHVISDTAPATNKLNKEPQQVRATFDIALASIRTDGHTQSRVAINEATVNEYAETLNDGAQLPPVIVFRDTGDYWLADGFHRLAAYHKSRRTTISADVRTGTQRDAILYAVGANSKHGLRRTNDDKRKAVGILLADAEWSKLTNREIARLCSVDHVSVANWRKPADPPAPPPTTGGGEITSKQKLRGGEFTSPPPPAGGTATGDATPLAQPLSPPSADDTNAADAHGDATLESILDETRVELAAAQKTIAAAQADEQTAEIIKWQQIAAVNERRANEHLGTIRKREAALTIMTKRLRAIGELVGEDDPDKLVAAVKLFVENAVAVS